MVKRFTMQHPSPTPTRFQSLGIRTIDDSSTSALFVPGQRRLDSAKVQLFEAIAQKRAEMNYRKRKQRALQLLQARLHHPVFRWSSAEDREWDSMAPVGREFGSPDYERLMQEDSQDLKRALAELISRSQAAVAIKGQPVDRSELSDARNVQTALREWGYEVDVLVAASIWRSYSHSLRAQWLSGAETVSAAKLALYYYCSRKRSSA